jgi:hypothetical protein
MLGANIGATVKFLFVGYHFLMIAAHRATCVADLEGSLEDINHAIAAQTTGPAAKRRIARIG